MYFTVESAPQHRLPLYKTVLCVTCALILIVNGFSLFHNLQSLKGANFLLGQTSRVAERLQYLNVLVLDAESSMRGYFVSGKEAYLGPTRTVSAETEAEFKELELLLADSPSQSKNLAQLHALVRRKLALMTQAIDVYRQAGLEEIVNIAKVSDDRSAMDEIRLLVVIMVQEQNEMLTKRSAAFYHEYQKAVLLGMGINAVAIVVLIMFYQLVRRSFMTRAAVEHALQSANENLESTVEQRTEQLSVLSRHLISISEEEKVRLSRELHDEMGANLTSISMDVAAVMHQLAKTQPELASQLKRARATLLDTVEMKRRIIENLRPSLLDNLGLCAAIESYCEEFSRLAQVPCDTDIASHVDGVAKARDASLAIALFRIVQESLTNIRKYAKATQVSVTLQCGEDVLTLRVIDDGVGIASNTLVKPMSHGLLGMRERALLLGGTLTIRRGRNDKGTCIEVHIPLRGKGSGAGREGVSSWTRLPAGDRTPFSPPYSTRPHSVPSLNDQ
ncbi:CHASE3 domain-containing protein [Pseudoduganella namucuonensis]|uniref:Signal transduction histidine kinase n=1 Tax=Pseudoduganella namucuonensis TaxID=1035707 RepID=A0A1I7HRT6_9BURK|nr:CHASE3 domain-containing protein [Pseudoduganella namucuonensis]SFU63455.1 Signal transduction histidine kinase [Pseudoduganella namucuonensis]